MSVETVRRIPNLSPVALRYLKDRGIPLKPVLHHVCEACRTPFIPKHYEPQYTQCQECHYGGAA